jgi:hypothetical protein
MILMAIINSVCDVFIFWFVLTVITEIREIQIDWSRTVGSIYIVLVAGTHIAAT